MHVHMHACKSVIWGQRFAIVRRALIRESSAFVRRCVLSFAAVLGVQKNYHQNQGRNLKTGPSKGGVGNLCGTPLPQHQSHTCTCTS